MALTGIYSLHSTTDLILRCGRLCAQEPTTLVSTLLIIQPPTKRTKHPTRIFPVPDSSGGPSDILFLTTRLKLHLIVRAPHHHRFQPKSFQVTQPGSIRNFQLKILPNHPAEVHQNFLTKTPSKLPSRGPFEISQENPYDAQSSHPFTRPRTIPSKYPSNTPFTKTYPQNALPYTQRTTHHVSPPMLPPLAPALINIIPGLYQGTVAAIQVTLYSPSRMDTVSGSSTRFSCASNRVQGLRSYSYPANLHSLSILFTVAST